jgi:hypothetical protein
MVKCQPHDVWPNKAALSCAGNACALACPQHDGVIGMACAFSCPGIQAGMHSGVGARGDAKKKQLIKQTIPAVRLKKGNYRLTR